MSTLSVSARVSIRNILLATDFSNISDAALPYAAGLARRYHSTLFTVNVVPELVHDFLPPDPFPPAHVANEKMRLFVNSDLLRGIPHKEYVEHGDVSVALHDFVAKWSVDLIVLGTHGRRGVQKVLLGSVAEDIFRHAQCPVLTIGPNVTHQIGAGELRHILYATDFGEETTRGLPYALSLAEEHHARFTLLHASPPPPDLLQDWEPNASPTFLQAETLAYAEAGLRRMIPGDAQLATHPEYRVQYGDPAAVIVEAARTVCADMIVMGVKRPLPLATHLRVGTVYKVVCEAPCPVLTVGHEFHL